MGVLDVFNWEGVSVAPGDTIVTVAPTWTRLDAGFENLRVAEVQIRRGRSSEFEVTGTGECTVGFNDRDGDVDPTVVDWMSRPFAFAVRNPVTDTWHPRFRGAVEDHRYNLHPSEIKGDVVIEAVDGLAFLSRIDCTPGDVGDPPPADGGDFVFWEDTLVTGPQIRINQALLGAGWPAGLSSIFTGNVNLLETVSAPEESLLSVIQDAAEAEFPTIGNFYADVYGVLCFHGRNARFDPVATAATATHWDFHQFAVGEGGIQIRPPYVVARERAMIRNVASCWPQDLPPVDRPGQVVSDAGSIAQHGKAPWTAPDLITKDGITSTLTGAEECLTFAQYVIDNYAQSEPHIRQLTFKALRPDDPRAAALWPLLCTVDISDQIAITKAHPGGGGLSAAVYFVEGITETWRPLVKDLDTGYPYVEMTLDLSPGAYWTTEPELPS